MSLSEMTTFFSPHASGSDPRAEIAEILAAGLIRLLVRKSTQILPAEGNSSLDISAIESGHAVSLRMEDSDD